MSGTRRPSRAAPLHAWLPLCTPGCQLAESPRAKRACTGSPLRRPALRLDGGSP